MSRNQPDETPIDWRHMWAMLVQTFHVSPAEAWEVTPREVRMLLEWVGAGKKAAHGPAMTVKDVFSLERKLQRMGVI